MRSSVTIGVAVMLWATSTQGQVYRGSVDAVRVDVLVTRGGTPLGGLTGADFEVRDNGVLQEITALAFDQVPLSVMFVVDASASVSGPSMVRLRDAATQAQRLLRDGDRVSVLSFASGVRLELPWTDHPAPAFIGFDGLARGRFTRLFDATFAALGAIDPSAARSLILLFTDGDDTASWLSGEAVLAAARRSHAVVYGIGPPTDARRPGFRLDLRSGVQPLEQVSPAALREAFLPALARVTGGRYLALPREGSLADAYRRILAEARQRYLLTYTPTGVEASGWHDLDVRVKKRGAQVTARRGYLR